MKSLRVRKWLNMHKGVRIELAHVDYVRLGKENYLKIVQCSYKHAKIVTVASQDVELLSGAGKPATVMKEIMNDVIRAIK